MAPQPGPVHWGVSLTLLGSLTLHPRSIFAAGLFIWFCPSFVCGRGGASSDDELLSLDSDDARTIRTRHSPRGRSRSPSRRIFPRVRRGPAGRLAIPIHLWDPTAPAGPGPIAGFAPTSGQVSLRILCPYSGWSEPRTVRPHLPWSLFENIGAGHCGRWAPHFTPVGGVGRRDSLVLVPIACEPFATVLLHGSGPARPAVVPRIITPAQFQHLAQGLDAGPSYWLSGPHAQMRADLTHLQLRNGDHFALSPDTGPEDRGHVEWPAFSTLGDAVAGACWSLPFTLLSPGLVWLWSCNSDRPEPVSVREDTWWDPDSGSAWCC